MPKVRISDNGPQFGSAAFRVFARGLRFSYVTSILFYPESNGLAERSVQIMKSVLVKSLEDS